MAKPSKWKWFWIAWLLALGIGELIAAIQRTRGKPKPVTFTEHIKHWFPWRWRRILLIGLLSLLVWHLTSGPQVQPIQVLP